MKFEARFELGVCVVDSETYYKIYDEYMKVMEDPESSDFVLESAQKFFDTLVVED